MKTVTNNGIPEIHPNDISTAADAQLIDVRRPDEFNGELGHIKNAQLITLGPDLYSYLQSADPAQKYIFVCRSGARSGQATAMSQEMGFNHTANLQGGMLLWNELKLPVERG